jgi:hypothetical protein
MNRHTFAAALVLTASATAGPVAAADDAVAAARPQRPPDVRLAQLEPQGPATVVRPVTPTPPSIMRTKDVAYEETTPDTGMIGTGVIVLGSTYIASMVVAARLGHEGDRQLYVPVVGPWLDLAKRPECASGRTDCTNETTNKVLLVGDGVLQAVGVLQILGGFAFPETRIVTKSVSFSVSPTVGASQLGFTAHGSF